MNNEPLTLFFLVERVARMREAQKRYDAIGSDYNFRQALALEFEIDALLIRIAEKIGSGELLEFAQRVTQLRQRQRRRAQSPTAVTEAECIPVERAIDQALEKYTAEVKRLNEGIAHDNAI